MKARIGARTNMAALVISPSLLTHAFVFVEGFGGGRLSARRFYSSEFRFIVLEITKYRSATPQMTAAISIQIFGSPPIRLAIMAFSNPWF